MGFKRENETEQTYRLKWSAWEWLFTVAGCRSIGMEVRLEGPGGRVVDLVGVGPGNIVYVVEVKASRPDFSRDNHTKQDLEALQGEGRVVAAGCGWPRTSWHKLRATHKGYDLIRGVRCSLTAKLWRMSGG